VRRDKAFKITGHALETTGDGYIHHSDESLAAVIEQLPIAA